MTLRTALNGPTPPPLKSDRQEDRQLIAGYDDGLKEVAVAHAALSVNLLPINPLAISWRSIDFARCCGWARAARIFTCAGTARATVDRSGRAAGQQAEGRCREPLPCSC